MVVSSIYWAFNLFWHNNLLINVVFNSVWEPLLLDDLISMFGNSRTTDVEEHGVNSIYCQK